MRNQVTVVTSNGVETEAAYSQFLPVELNKIRADVLEHNLMIKGDAFRGTPLQMVRHLEGIYSREGVRIIPCEVCLGRRPESFEACPYCGLVIKKETLKEVKVKNAKTVKERSLLATYIAEIDALVRGITHSAWHIGKCLNALHDKTIWLLAIDEHGNRFKNFEQFCFSKWGFRKTAVYDFMRINREFTEEFARKYPSTSLIYAASIPKENRDEIFKALDKGANCEAIRLLCFSFRENYQPEHTPDGEPGEIPEELATPMIGENPNSMVQRSDIARSMRIKLFKPLEDGSPGKMRARLLFPPPTGEAIIDGKQVRFRIDKTKTGLVLVISPPRRRVVSCKS